MQYNNSELLKAKIENYSDEKVKSLRALGQRVIGFHDVPPTASRAELWTGQRVEEYLMALVISRIAEDIAWNGSIIRRKSKRASAIVYRSCLPLQSCVEFRRIYPTFWTAALCEETEIEMIQQLCVLARELDTLASNPETDQRAHAISTS